MSNVSGAKVTVILKAVGSATQLKKAELEISGTRTISEVLDHVKKKLNTESDVHLYCGHVMSAFSPTPDMTLQDLHNCFQLNGKLEIMYGIQPTFG
jgi:ubiquitin-like protein ATG12